MMNQKFPKIKGTQGQAAVIMIILTTIALVFFAITLNWGRMAQYKTATMVAATTASSQAASGFASYGEKILQESVLKGKYKICYTTNILTMILLLVVLIIVVIICWGFCSPIIVPAVVAMGIIAAALLTVSIILQITVVQPGLTRLWNKMQKNVPIQEQFMLAGLQTGIQNVVTDHVNVVDYLDYNTNGKAGYDAVKFKAIDKISRFGFYFTEHMRSAKGNLDLDLKPFLDGLKDVTASAVSVCTDPKDPRCNSCCLPLNDLDGKRLRPQQNAQGTDCTTDVFPLQCQDLSLWPYAQKFPLAHDNTYPDLSKTDTLLGQLGLDAEVRPFNPADATGLFKYFWDMDAHLWKATAQPKDPMTISPSINDLVTGGKDTRFTDSVTQILNFQADDRTCVGHPSETPPAEPTTGFWWKKGVDRYCSLTNAATGKPQWPYDQCPKDALLCNGTETNVNIPCGCQPGAGQQWPHDFADDFVFAMKEFSLVSQRLSAIDEDDLKVNMDTWYQNVARWVGPACDGTNDATCYEGGIGAGPGGTNLPGQLFEYKDRLALWKTWLDDWRKDNYADDNSWCVPTNGSALAAPERDMITAAQGPTGTWGELPTVLACLAYNSANDVRFNRCLTTISDPAFCAAGTPPKPAACLDLPRSLAGDEPLTFDPCAVPSVYKDWVTNSHALAGPRPTGGGYLAYKQCQDDVALDIAACLTVPAPSEPLSCSTLPVDPALKPSYDACSGTAYKAWIDALVVASENSEDLKYKKCQDDIQDGLRLCAGGVVPPKPASCTGLPIAPGQPPEPGVYDICNAVSGTVPSDYKTWVDDSYADILENSQSARFTARGVILKRMLKSAQDISLAIEEFEPKLDEFLNKPLGPVQSLLDARQHYVDVYVPSLPSFVIYGWRDPNTPKNTSRLGGYWHVVRVDIQAPTVYCPSGLCGARRLPYVKTYSKGWLTRCMELWDRVGNIFVRVSRWDEDHEPGVFFNNKAPIWQFLYHKPDSPPAGSSLAGACVGASTPGSPSWRHIGINQTTIDALRPVWGLEGSQTTESALMDAFMISGKPDGSNPEEAECYDAVTRTLMRGTTSYSCAQYNLAPDKRHMQVVFQACPTPEQLRFGE